MPHPIAYLSFDGTCADAMRFYARVLEGSLEMMSYADSPFADQTPAEHRARILHARLTFPDGGALYAADCPPQQKSQGIHGVGVTLNFDSIADAERAFTALADGGQVHMPFGESFWAKRFGMVVDRYGCPWLVNAQLLPLAMPGR